MGVTSADDEIWRCRFHLGLLGHVFISWGSDASPGNGSWAVFCSGADKTLQKSLSGKKKIK